jgi:peptide/nickel transport system substrate-binding protein
MPMRVSNFALSRRSLLLSSAALAMAPRGAQAATRTAIVIGMSVEPSGLDPTIAAPVAIGQVTWQNVFQGLTRINATGAIQPQLARSWTISPDGLTYSFALRTDAKFHNGKPFTAETAKFTLDRARGASSTNPQKQFYTVITGIETPDPATLVLTLAKPAGNLLYWLGWPASVMVEPGSADANKTDPVGTGPFRFSSWRKGDRVELVRSPDYWDAASAAKLERATFRFINDPQAQTAALKAGDVDAFPEFGAPELYAAFQKDSNFAAVTGNTELKVVAGMNCTRKPFNDVRVRQVLMMAVDRKMLVEGVSSGFGSPIGSHYTPNDPGYRDFTGVHPYDPAKAKALLAAAGYPNGLTFSIKTPQMAYAARSTEILQAMFAEIGVTANIVPTEFPAKWVQEVLLGRDFDMTIVAHAEPLDIAIYARKPYYFNYENPEFDGVIASAEQSTDTATRLAFYGKAQEILARDVPALFLYVQPKLGVWNAKVRGLWQNEPIPSNDLTAVTWAE